LTKLQIKSVKLIRTVKTEQDTINLQSDIDNQIKWCSLNNLSININKCKFMHFFLIKNTINFQYYVSDSKIEIVSHFKDLGIIFDTKLNFSLHSEMIKNNGM
jgi:hypothetical protein